MDEAKEPLDVKMNILVKVKVTLNDVDNDVFHMAVALSRNYENEYFGESESDMLTSNGDLVVAVHPELGSDLTDNHTGQRLVGRRVPQLKKKTKKVFF